MPIATPSRCVAGIVLLTVAVVVFARGDVDPTGTYDYRRSDYAGHPWPLQFTVVIRPMRRGGWSTTWANAGGHILWRGTLTRLPGGRFLEHWRPTDNTAAPVLQNEWQHEGGRLIDPSERTTSLEPCR